MFDVKDQGRDALMLTGPMAMKGYDCWWHTMTGVNEATGEERSFYIAYFACNPFLRRVKPTFGQLPKNRQSGIRPSYVMVKAGCFGAEHCQLHRFFAWPDVQIQAKAPFELKVEDCLVSETNLCGSISVKPEDARAHAEWMTDAGDMSWNLEIEKKLAYDPGHGAAWHAEGLKTAYSGKITLNGERYTVRAVNCRGYADKQWGSDLASPRLWLTSCDLTDRSGKPLRNSAFTLRSVLNRGLLGARTQIAGGLWYEGKAWELDTLAMNGAKVTCDCSSKGDEIRWHVVMSGAKTEMLFEATCRKSEMVLMNLEAPSGEKRHNHLWAGGNGKGRIQLYEKNNGDKKLVDELSVSHIVCEYGEYDGKKR